MKIALDTGGTIAGFSETLGTIIRDDETKGLLVFSCADNEFTPNEIDPMLAEIPLPVFGGIFPGIMYQDHVYERGTLVVGLPKAPKIQLIEGLSHDRDNFDDIIDSAVLEKTSSGTMIALVDGMSLHVNSFLESVFNLIGLGMGYIGGGAGSMDLIQKPCLFTNSGLKQDCAILAHLGVHSGIGVAHGMDSVDGPYKVTKSSFNTINSIDWQPAAKLYKDLISSRPDYDVKKLSFIETDAHYSLGLNRFQAERVILEPAQVGPDDSLVFMQEVREGEFVDIMRVTAETMIKSAESSIQKAIDDYKGAMPPQTLMSFDCVSRKLFLDARFEEELKTICAAGIPHIGVLTFGGEIGTTGRDFLDYHNRTCVAGVFEE